MNLIVLNGRLTKDIELKYTENNKAFVNTSIAVRRNYKNTNGEYDTDFFNINVWEHNAEFLNKYAKKGDMILIRGRVLTRLYEKDDIKMPIITIQVENIDLLSSAKKKEENKTEVKEEKKGLNDDVFADFGNSIEISDDDIAF